MNYQIISAFATPIGVAKLSQELCEPLKQFKGMEQIINEREKEERDYYVLDKLPDLKKQLIKVFSDYINLKILHTPNQEYTMTTSWITENRKGDPMERHCHVNSYYSSVLYYDKVVKEHPPLILEPPNRTSGFFVLPNVENVYSHADSSFPIEEGLILFFPSSIYHYHDPFKSEVPRKSLACNYIPINQFGRGDSTLDTRKIHG